MRKYAPFFKAVMACCKDQSRTQLEHFQHISTGKKSNEKNNEEQIINPESANLRMWIGRIDFKEKNGRASDLEVYV